MRLRIDKIWFIVVALVLSVPSAHAQIVTANPLEWMALAEGNEAINGEIEKEIKGQTKTALLQNTIAAEFTALAEEKATLIRLRESIIFVFVGSEWRNSRKFYWRCHGYDFVNYKLIAK